MTWKAQIWKEKKSHYLNITLRIYIDRAIAVGRSGGSLVSKAAKVLPPKRKA